MNERQEIRLKCLELTVQNFTRLTVDQAIENAGKFYDFIMAVGDKFDVRISPDYMKKVNLDENLFSIFLGCWKKHPEIFPAPEQQAYILRTMAKFPLLGVLEASCL